MSRRWTPQIDGKPLPAHVRSVDADGIAQVKLIDATPIGINVRSTVATYANVHDELRKIFAAHARTPRQARATKRAIFPTTRASCAAPSATAPAVISLDVQFLPDVDIPCPDCRGSRYAKEADGVKLDEQAGGTALPAAAHGHGRQHGPDRLCGLEDW